MSVAAATLLLLVPGWQGNGAFRAPVPVTRFDAVRRGGRTVAVDLARDLPGVPAGTGRYRFPFADPVEHLEVLASHQGVTTPCTVIVAGGVRTPLSFHVLRDGRHASMTFATGRLMRGFFRPLVDRHGAALACLFEDDDGVQLRVLSVLGKRPALLLARGLESAPAQFVVRSVLGDPRVSVFLGNVGLEKPGQVKYRPSTEPPSFLHPLARLPVPSTLRVDFGDLARGARVARRVELANPGALALRLILRPEEVQGWKLEMQPAALTLAPGERSEIVLTLSCSEPPPALAGRIEIRGSSEAGDPLAQLMLRARGVATEDTEAPALDPKLVLHELLPGRRAKLVGLQGAVEDESDKCVVGDASGATAEVAADGSFELTVPLKLDGQVFLWTRDGKGNQSRPRYVAQIKDEKAPQWKREAVSLGLPERGEVLVRGAAGAVSDDTTPISIEVTVGGTVLDKSFPVRPDGSFLLRVPALPGQRVRLVALDGAALFNRSPPLELGRVLPFVARKDGELVLHGPPRARFRIAPCLPATDDAPETVLRTFAGVLDGRCSVRLDPEKVGAAKLLRFVVTVRGTGRALSGRWRSK